MTTTEVTTITSLPNTTKKGKCILFFYAEWHESSKSGSKMDTIFKSLASSTSNNNIFFYKVEAEATPELSHQFQVTVVPTFVLLNESNEIIEKIEGSSDPARLTQAVGSLLTQSKTPVSDVNNRIKALLSSNPVMLFMKGSRHVPKCGFSRQMTELLTQNDIIYETFDILQDNDIRQGLKVYSDWPTYPQLYVNAELVGGLDIIKEIQSESSSPTEFANAIGIQPQKNLQDRLHDLTHNTDSPIMLFMKGTPSAPKCGFSRQIVEILQEQNVTFHTFDILQDNDIRQGLKTYSDWPTFPQLYVNGEFVGGLDIVREMKDNGELSSALAI